MRIENWQSVDEHLVVDNDKAIIVKDSKLLDKPEALKTEMQKSGQPVKEVRKKLVQKSVKSKVKTDPLKISGWFDRKHESDNAHKAEKLQGNKPVRQYKQIKNELGSKFEAIFKTITADNGAEFSELTKVVPDRENGGSLLRSSLCLI